MFTEKFEQMLQSRGFKPYHIAKTTGISPGLMSEYKNGVKLPTIQNLAKIADALDCSVDYLLGRSDIPDIVTIDNYELLNDQAKMLVADYIRIMAKDNKYRKAPAPSGTSFADTLDIAAFGGKASQTGVDEDDIITTT